MGCIVVCEQSIHQRWDIVKIVVMCHFHNSVQYILEFSHIVCTTHWMLLHFHSDHNLNVKRFFEEFVQKRSTSRRDGRRTSNRIIGKYVYMEDIDFNSKLMVLLPPLLLLLRLLGTHTTVAHSCVDTEDHPSVCGKREWNVAECRRQCAEKNKWNNQQYLIVCHFAKQIFNHIVYSGQSAFSFASSYYRNFKPVFHPFRSIPAFHHPYQPELASILFTRKLFQPHSSALARRSGFSSFPVGHYCDRSCCYCCCCCRCYYCMLEIIVLCQQIAYIPVSNAI